MVLIRNNQSNTSALNKTFDTLSGEADKKYDLYKISAVDSPIKQAVIDNSNEIKTLKVNPVYVDDFSDIDYFISNVIGDFLMKPSSLVLGKNSVSSFGSNPFNLSMKFMLSKVISDLMGIISKPIPSSLMGANVSINVYIDTPNKSIPLDMFNSINDFNSSTGGFFLSPTNNMLSIKPPKGIDGVVVIDVVQEIVPENMPILGSMFVYDDVVNPSRGVLDPVSDLLFSSNPKQGNYAEFGKKSIKCLMPSKDLYDNASISYKDYSDIQVYY